MAQADVDSPASFPTKPCGVCQSTHGEEHRAAHLPLQLTVFPKVTIKRKAQDLWVWSWDKEIPHQERGTVPVIGTCLFPAACSGSSHTLIDPEEE